MKQFELRKTIQLVVCSLLLTWASSATAAGEQPAPQTSDDLHPWARTGEDSDLGPESVPTLEDRELGEPLTENGERVVWDRMLPFFGQTVTDLGFDLPNPYGVALIGYWQKQDLLLKDLSISVNNGPWQDIDFVDFESPNVENGTFQLKLDA